MTCGSAHQRIMASLDERFESEADGTTAIHWLDSIGLLDWRMGDLLGIFGVRNIQANPLPKSTQISEAGVVGGVLQRNVSSCSVTNTENCWFDGFAVTHNCDIIPGHSGGPIFLLGTPAIAIGVNSAEFEFIWHENVAAGGPDFVKLTQKWTKAFP